MTTGRATRSGLIRATHGLLPRGLVRIHLSFVAAVLLVSVSACVGQQTNTDGPLRLPTATMAAAVTSLGRTIYVIGGMTRTRFVSKVYECDPLNRSCSEKAALPTETLGASAAEIAGLLYVTGGRDNQGVIDRLIVYTPSTDSWVSKRSMATARWLHMSAVVRDRLYVFGGIKGTGRARRVLGDVAAYDPARDQWEHVGLMPEAVQAAAVAVVDDKVYLIGGRTETYETTTGSSASAAVHEFDPETATWRNRRPMPTARTGAAAAVRDGKIFVVGGARADQAVRTVEVYDPATDTWETRTPLQTARTGHGAVAMEDRIYIIAGARMVDPLRLVRQVEELPR